MQNFTNVTQINKSFSKCQLSTTESISDFDKKIARFISDRGITKEKNSFFKLAKQMAPIKLQSALSIAFNWREITKQFMFTTLTSLGTLAEKIGALNSPPQNIIRALQTGVAVIADDLNNVFAEFQAKAPNGPAGVHYQWWEDTILNPLIKQAAEKNYPCPSLISPNTQNLLLGMLHLAKNPLGTAVQLRVVEAIALDIVLAFRPLFAAVEVDGKKLFPHRDDLVWINSHIKAEVVHHRQVTDTENGMMCIASTPEEQQEILMLSKEYVDLWGDVFDEFEYFLKSTQ
jgi:hypothetical protein